MSYRTVWCIDCWLYAYVDDMQTGPGCEQGTLGVDVLKELGKTVAFKEDPAVLGKFQGIHMQATKAGIWWDQHAQARGAMAGVKETKYKEPLPVSNQACLLYTSPSPRDGLLSRMPSSA